MRNPTLYFFISIPVALLFCLVAVITFSTPSSAQSNQIPAVTQSDHIYGNKNADIFLVKYSDFACPYCDTSVRLTKQAVQESDGQVALVYRHYPILGQNSVNAAEASECVAELGGNDAFWEYTQLLFAYRPTSLQQSGLVQHASQAGAYEPDFVSCLSSNRYESVAQPNISLFIPAVPTTFVMKNGEVYSTISGSQPLQNIREHINNALSSAVPASTTPAPTPTDSPSVAVDPPTSDSEVVVIAPAPSDPLIAQHISINYLPEWSAGGLALGNEYLYFFTSSDCCEDLTLYSTNYQGGDLDFIVFNEADVFLRVRDELTWSSQPNEDINKVINAAGYVFDLNQNEINRMLTSLYSFIQRSALREVEYLTQPLVLGNVRVVMNYSIDVDAELIEIRFSRFSPSWYQQIPTLQGDLPQGAWYGYGY